MASKMDLKMEWIVGTNQDVQTGIAKNLCLPDRFHGFSGLTQPTSCDEMKSVIENFQYLVVSKDIYHKFPEFY